MQSFSRCDNVCRATCDTFYSSHVGNMIQFGFALAGGTTFLPVLVAMANGKRQLDSEVNAWSTSCRMMKLPIEPGLQVPPGFLQRFSAASLASLVSFLEESAKSGVQMHWGPMCSCWGQRWPISRRSGVCFVFGIRGPKYAWPKFLGRRSSGSVLCRLSKSVSCSLTGSHVCTEPFAS